MSEPANGAVILAAENISKTFQVRGGERLGRKIPVTVLDDISLSVERGESFGLVGESGCGKSTLARCLLRLLDLSAGRVLFDGVDLNDARPRQAARVAAAHAVRLPGPLRLA